MAAPKGNKFAVDHGRPTKYSKDLDEITERLTLLGFTVEDLAKHLDVQVSTITLWRKKYPSFSAALNAGRLVADAGVVKSLYNRARGYTEIVTKVETDSDGNIIKTITEEKHFPPDTTAAIYWTKNRQPKYWRNSERVEAGDESDEDVRNFNINFTVRNKVTDTDGIDASEVNDADAE